MKKRRLLTFCSMVAVVVLASCSNDFLDTKPLDKVSANATWSDGALSEAFVFNVYSFLNYGGFEEESLASLTDEAMFTHSGRGMNVINEGTLSETTTGNVNIIPQWDELFLAIRQANIAIKELPEATFDNDDLKSRLLGEAHFLRAYYQSQVVRYYGGAPIIDRPYELNEDYAVARNTYSDNVDYMVGDLDMAASLLDGKPQTPGRANQLSALALKSRILVYAASDLRDGPTASAKSTAHSSYANLELVALYHR